VKGEILFTDALENQERDFGLVRGIANAAKHLELRPSGIRPFPGAPSRAGDTSLSTGGAGGWGENAGGYGVGAQAYAGPERVVLAGPPERKFSEIAETVYNMWNNLRATNGW
jgi:hypothetical protein